MVHMKRIGFRPTASRLGQFTMQMQHLLRTSALVKVVHILSDDLNVHAFLPGGQLFVPRVGLGLPNRSTTLVVKPGHEFRVAHPSLRRRHIFNPVAFPEASRSTKGRNAAFCAHTGSSQHHQMFRDVHRSKLRKRPQVFGLSLTSMSQRHFIIYDLEATCWRSRAPKRLR